MFERQTVCLHTNREIKDFEQLLKIFMFYTVLSWGAHSRLLSLGPPQGGGGGSKNHDTYADFYYHEAGHTYHHPKKF